MRFADPSRCPSCQSVLTGDTSCRSCGFDLTSLEARQLWQTLLTADELLERARVVSRSVGAASPVGSATLPSAPPLPPAARQQRTLSTGGIILALGAVCLLVAGFIFITVSWGSLGVTGRALVLLAFTAVIGGLALVVTRRGLRGSSEALWTVFLGMLTLDWFAAWGQDLFGFGDVPFVTVAMGWALVVLGAAAVILRRVEGGASLVMPQMVAGLAPWVGATSLAIEVGGDWRPFWAMALAILVGAAFLAVSVWQRMRWSGWIVGLYVAGAALVAVNVAISDVATNPSVAGLVNEGHGLPMLVVIGAAAATGVLPQARSAATTAVVVGTVYLVAAPLEDRFTDRGALVATAAAAVITAAVHRAGPVGRGVRWASLATSAATFAMTGLWAAAMLEGVAERWVEAGTLSLLAEQQVGSSAHRWWWVPLVSGAALAGVAVLARSWPEIGTKAPQFATPVAVLAAGSGILMAASAFDGPYIVLALVAIAVGLAFTWPRFPGPLRLVGLVVIALGATFALPTQTGTTLVWAVGVIAFAAVALTSSEEWDQSAAALGGTVLLGGVAAQTVDLSGRGVDGVAIALVLAGAVGLAMASVLLRRWLGRLGVEGGGLLLLAVGILTALGAGEGWLALMWTIAGAVLVVLGLLVSDRMLYRWVGSVALGIAYVLRLAASDIEVVEAYTMPFGVVLLAIGVWTLRREDGPRSVVALGAGLTLSLLPSMPQALSDPTSVRALLLGLGGLLAVGVGVWRRWQAPFVAGVITVALVVLVNVGPYALAMPRWAIIAAAGAILLGVGVTWEDRIRDGRAATRFVGEMR